MPFSSSVLRYRCGCCFPPFHSSAGPLLGRVTLVLPPDASRLLGQPSSRPVSRRAHDILPPYRSGLSSDPPYFPKRPATPEVRSSGPATGPGVCAADELDESPVPPPEPVAALMCRPLEAALHVPVQAAPLFTAGKQPRSSEPYQ